MARRKEVYPDWFSIALQNARDRGSELAEFDTESECVRERLRFYRFLRETKDDASNSLADAAKRCVVQWLCAPDSKSKRFLKFELQNATSNPLAKAAGVDRAKVEEQLEIERAMEEFRRSIGEGGKRK